MTVAVDTACHFVPAVFMAMTVKRWLPAPRLSEVLSAVLVVSVYFFTPSTHSSTRASVPVMAEAACTFTGELTVDPLDGEQMFTPGEDGALHAADVGIITRAFGVDAMVYGEPGTAVILLDVTVYA